jgi:serine/threonine-protein kinase
VRRDDDRGRWGPIVAVAVAFSLLLALIVVLLVQSDLGSGKSKPTADVPTAVGQPFAQAQTALETAGLKVARHDVNAPDQDADIVIGQNPEAGSKAPKGSDVTLDVSSPTIPMPNVVGQPRDQAQSNLARVYLIPNFVEIESEQPPGTVLSTDPAAGAPVAKLPPGTGRPTVTVNIAREPLVPVPDVANQNPFAAGALLKQAGFQVTPVDTPSDTVPAGTVIGTDPAAGTPITKGSTVKVLVSTGSNLVDVPNVVGQTKAEAEQLLFSTLGFGLTETMVNAGPANKGKVVAQSPSSGKAPKGSAIALSIGS